MDVKLVLLIFGLLTLLDTQVEAAFWYDSPIPNAQQIKTRGLKCIPGSTAIKIGQETLDKKEDSEEARRTHMNTKTNYETCEICVCSTEGKDMYCSKRPARNVNECIRLSLLKKRVEKNMPFEHERSLSFRIRRDYIWHNDEIPYEAKATCKRSTSYYSNSINANNTDIDVASDIDSLLDYSNKDVCFFCVCSVDGRHAGCISRSPWFCEYYRVLRTPGAAKHRYHRLFQQDRPAYFRQISYRLRRTMDDGLVAFYDAGGDTLCCSHPDGHRRSLHNQVRTKIRLMRRKVPKENILSRSPSGDYVDFIVNND
ncbi:jg17198 [Pararge aegeria aegeria]|uniref:Jg17198 protein n=1 Tax=Pararge aegeria aegeria TaxID=348720 RepID=A0A8S4SDB6_9NEOP|nr:jg17198 [Pararge aegeria aegeria]